MAYVFTFRFIKLFSYMFAKIIQEGLNENHKKRYVYYYSIQIVFGGLIKVMLLCILGNLLNVLSDVLIIGLVFGLIRPYTGGFHFNSYTFCAYVTIFIFILSGIISKMIQQSGHWSNYYFIIIFIILIIVIDVFAPVANKNREITCETEKMKFKKNAIRNAIFIFIITNVMNNNMVISVSIAMLLIIFVTCPKNIGIHSEKNQGLKKKLRNFIS